MTAIAKKTLIKQTNLAAALREHMDRKSRGGELQILKHMLKSMEISTAALSLPKLGSAPLFLGLSCAMTGIHSGDSAAGIVGPNLAGLIESLTQGVVTAVMPNAGLAERRLLNMVCTLAYSSLICLALNAAAKGIGRLPTNLEAADVKLVNFFTFELAMRLLNSTSALKDSFAVCLEACGASKKAQAIGATLLAQTGMVLAILAGSGKGGMNSAGYIVEEEKGYLKRGANAAMAAIAGLEGMGSINPALSIAISQLKIALNESSQEDVMQALNSLLEISGASLEGLMADIKLLNQVNSTLTWAVDHRHEEESLTGIINVI